MSTTKVAPTKGPWVVEKHNGHEALLTFGGTIHTDFSYSVWVPIKEADVTLIADAGTTYHETGKTPSELAREYARVRHALDWFVHVCGHSPPHDFRRNLAEAVEKARAALSAFPEVAK